MEIITGVERRRRWRLEDKLRIVAEAEQPGACLSKVARRHEVSRGLLCHWREQVRRGALAAEVPVFMPVRVMAALPAPTPAPEPSGAMIPASPRRVEAAAGDGRIEIALADGTCIRVGGDVGLAALRRVMAVLRA